MWASTVFNSFHCAILSKPMVHCTCASIYTHDGTQNLPWQKKYFWAQFEFKFQILNKNMFNLAYQEIEQSNKTSDKFFASSFSSSFQQKLNQLSTPNIEWDTKNGPLFNLKEKILSPCANQLHLRSSKKKNQKFKPIFWHNKSTMPDLMVKCVATKCKTIDQCGLNGLAGPHFNIYSQARPFTKGAKSWIQALA